MESISVNVVIQVGSLLVTIGVLWGVATANQRSMGARIEVTNAQLKLMNEHLKILNDKTFKSHNEIGFLQGTVSSLDCVKKGKCSEKGSGI